MFLARRPRPPRRAQPAGARFRPRIEALEDRTVLAPTTTTLSTSVNPAAVGQSITFTAAITGGDFDAGLGSPPATVTFLDGTASLQTVTVMTDPANHQGVARFTTSSLAVGSHAITAQYSGEKTTTLIPGLTLTDSPSTSNAVTEFVGAVDVSALIHVTLKKARPAVVVVGQGPHAHRRVLPHRFQVQATLQNTGGTLIPGPFDLVLDKLPKKVALVSPSPGGTTLNNPPLGDPFEVVSVPQLNPGDTAMVTLIFKASTAKSVKFATRVFAGLGSP